MQERLLQIWNRVKEWWGRFTSRQKTIIISASAGIALTLVILITLLNQTQYIYLLTAASAKEASDVRDLLEGNITYRVSSDGTRFEVDKRQEADAIMLMGANNLQAAGWSIDNVTTGGFSTTEADKQKRYKFYLEQYIATFAMSLNQVKSAIVILEMPDNTGTLLSQEKESTATIRLELIDDMSDDQAANLAKAVAVGLGKKNAAGIVIIDTDGNMLYDGDNIYASGGQSANSQIKVQEQAQTLLNSRVRQVLQGTNEFTKIVVSSNLAIDWSSMKSVDNRYYYDDGRDSGFLVEEDLYNSESTMGSGGVPGTTSNTEDGSYQYMDNTSSSSTESESHRNWVVSQIITELEKPAGAFIRDQSSMAITATRVVTVREEDVRSQGLLDGITWDEYKLNNSTPTVIDVDDQLVELAANGSGIPLGSITIRAYSENFFVDAEGFSLTWTEIAQIGLIIIILGLLAFVVLRSMRSDKEEVLEEELSIENLLQSQPELDTIAIDEGSEAKKMIEKFIDENPEAAASLLRNWLNEDWG
jgi:flagellar M-ring protein FliF